MKEQLMRKLLACPDGVSPTATIMKKLRTAKGHPSKGYDDDKIHQILKAFEWY